MYLIQKAASSPQAGEGRGVVHPGLTQFCFNGRSSTSMSRAILLKAWVGGKIKGHFWATISPPGS
jgi:hypothetical protein